LVSGVYPRRRPWEAFAVGRFDFLDAFAAFRFFAVADLLGPFDPFDPRASERLSG
jgi:hypothetical protein